MAWLVVMETYGYVLCLNSSASVRKEDQETERQKHGAQGGSWEPAGFSRQVKSQGRMVRGSEGEAGESTLFSGTFYSSKLLLFSPDYSERPLSSDLLCPTLKAKRGPGRASSLAKLPGDLHDNTLSPRVGS